MNKKELAEALAKHKKWWRGEEGGERADLSGSDLSGRNLRGSDLSWSDLSGCNLRGSDLSGCNLRGSDLSGSDLRGSDLSGCNLRGSDLHRSNLAGSNLRGAILDFASWPLSCGSFDVKVDDRFVFQLIAHITRLDISGCTEDAKAAVNALDVWKNKFCNFRDDVGTSRPGARR